MAISITSQSVSWIVCVCVYKRQSERSEYLIEGLPFQKLLTITTVVSGNHEVVSPKVFLPSSSHVSFDYHLLLPISAGPSAHLSDLFLSEFH